MREIGELLRNYIKLSGNSIYGISKIAHVNRSTLEKILTENRKPKKELIEALIPHLKLSPEEKEELLNLLEVLNTGEELYNQRNYIKELIIQTSEILRGNILDLTKDKKNVSLAIPFKNQQIFHGEYFVQKIINELIAKECQQKMPQIYLNIPGNLKLISDILLHTIYYCPGYEKLKVSHVVYFSKIASNRCIPAANLTVLGNVIPFIATSSFDYNVFYYYCDTYTLSQITLTAFPYYVTGKDWSVLLSSDCKTCMFCESADIRDHLNNLFEAELKHASPLASVCEKPEDILPVFIGLNNGKLDFPFMTLEYQPCLAAYLTEEILQKYVKPGIQNYEQNIQLLSERIKQLQHLENRISVFTKSGLQQFTEEGLLSDFPPEYVDPFEPEDRIYLLKNLFQEIMEGRQTHCMINPLAFPVTEYFNYVLTRDSGIVFLGFNEIRRNYNYIVVKESTLIKAFEDFTGYLATSMSVYTKDETLEFIQACIQLLE